MGLMDDSTFADRLLTLAREGANRPHPYYIIRDPHGPNDHGLVWNWQKQVWGWDTDGDYRDRGWAYKDASTAKASRLGNATRPLRNYRTSGDFWANPHRTDPINVRVVSEWELYQHLGLEKPYW